MQHALRFLEAVLPASGLRVVASKPPQWKGGFRHTFCETNEEVVAETVRLDRAGTTNYIALATYQRPTGGRTAANTSHLQCLWMDVDYKNYDSSDAAIADVARLFPVVGAPTIRVQSGAGLHLYWALRRPVPTALWKRIADAFQAAWQSLGIEADPISADAARVLRLPGSHNFKYDPPVEVTIEAFDDVSYDPIALATRLASTAPKSATPAMPARVVAPTPLGGANDDLSAGLNSRPAYAKNLIAKCAQARYVYSHQEKVQEPLWYAMLGVVKFLEDGRKVAHVFSNKHPGYSAEETDAKLAQLDATGVGPTTCAVLRQRNPKGCEGCPHNVTSPIVLAREEPASVDPVVVVEEHTVTPAGEAITVQREAPPAVPIPAGFSFDGTSMRRLIEDEADGGKSFYVELFRGYICPERLIVNERNNHSTDIQLYVHSEGQAPKRIVVPAKALADKRDMSRELAGKGVLHMAKNSAHILDLLQRMTQQVQSSRRDVATVEQMGWQDDGSFVVGSTGYRPNESPVFDLPVPAATKQVVHQYEPAGSLEAWKRTANIYNRPGGEAYQFALCYGAAGVFLPETRLSGVVLSLYSQEAGRGKSTAGYAALSWWGNPEATKSQSKDTSNAMFHKASRHKNLPMLLDEITDKPTYELEDLVYFMSQGREKERLTSEATARPILPGWALPVISTSNNSIKSKLQVRRGDTHGLFARIIEVPMDLPFAQDLGYTDRMALRNGFFENYGHAGPKIVQFVMEHRDLCTSILDSYAVKFDQAVQGDAAYRFWVASCAATLTAASIAKHMGLLSYDLDALSNWAVATLNDQREAAVSAIASSDDVLAQFLEMNANRIVVSYQRSVGGGGSVDMIWPDDGVRGNMLVGRVEMSARSLYVSTSAFGRFCAEAGFDLASFTRNAAANVAPGCEEPLLKRSSVSINLGRGTRNASARTSSLEFNLMHPALREFAIGIDSNIPEAAHLRSVK